MVLGVENVPASAAEVRGAGLTHGSGDHPLEEEMATYSSIPTWRIPWTEEPNGLLQSMGLQKSRTQLSGLAQQPVK